MFKIGEKVVCINPIGNLTENKIYTVEGFNSYDNGLILKEIKSIKYVGAFKSFRFRKLDYEFAENLLSEIAKDFMKEENLKIQSN